jgi:hypothetical protein
MLNTSPCNSSIPLHSAETLGIRENLGAYTMFDEGLNPDVNFVDVT